MRAGYVEGRGTHVIPHCADFRLEDRKISWGLGRRGAATLYGGEPQLVSEGYDINPVLSTPTSRRGGVIKTGADRAFRRRKVTSLEASKRT